jgi:hypothetical protein
MPADWAALKELLGTTRGGNPIEAIREALGLDDAGGTPAAGCRIWNDAATTILYDTASGSPFAHPWNRTLFDTHGMHDNVTNNSRITIPAYSVLPRGLWYFRLHAYMTGLSVTIAVDLMKNGNEPLAEVPQADFSNWITVMGGAERTLDIGGLWIPNAGEYVETIVTVPTGGAAFQHNAKPTQTFMEAIYLGKTAAAIESAPVTGPDGRTGRMVGRKATTRRFR